MRVYLPATASDLRREQLTPRRAHAVTAQLRQALAQEDEEGLETSATLCAADSSLLLLTAQPDEVVDRRVVVAADVKDADVTVLEVSDEVLPGTVEVSQPVAWSQVAAILADEAAAEPDVHQARQGDEEAFERAAEADLLWYDVTERAHLAQALTAR